MPCLLSFTLFQSFPFMLSYQTVVEELFALGHELARMPAHKFDLAHMRVLAKGLEHPERRFPSVLIAGTNGKGSTAATLASILRAAGHRTGLYTSPHLVRINERIQINGEPIGDSDFSRVYEQVHREAQKLVAAGALPHEPSFFEMLTAMAFEHFAATKIDIAVLEVGMGGRLDATNITEPLVAVVTDIALDHQKFLGETIGEIAQEKAGIIHAGGTVVLLPQHPAANDVLGRAVVERGARAISAVPYVAGTTPAVEAEAPLRQGEAARNRYTLQVLGEEITVDSPLGGRHQLRNLALAIAASVELNDQGIKITAHDIERGVRQTRWPGRLQLVAGGKGQPDVLLDVAHNPAGAWVLRAALSQHYEGRRICMVFGAMRDKAVAEMADILFPLAEHVVATQANNPRSATPAQVLEAGARTGAEIVCEPDIAAALGRARSLAGAEGLVVVTGSIYVVGETLEALQA